jgi:hypothetical protein
MGPVTSVELSMAAKGDHVPFQDDDQVAPSRPRA